MIIVKLSGGLGNQMFQAATGIALSKKFNARLKFDLSFLQENSISTTNFTARDFRINVFNNNFDIATEKEISLFFNENIKHSKLSFNRIRNRIFRPVIIIDTWDPVKIFDRAGRYTYLDGFWQGEEYFKGYESEILDLFKFPKTDAKFVNYFEKVKSSNSVSVHFRRGDYINNQHIRSIHNVCDTNYYLKAIEYLSLKQKGTKLFLFSDEPEWLYDNFKANVEFEIIDTKSDITDMHLMSLCKHNIIANSSFSWWGAWLNQYPGKIVIAPKQWFATDIVNYEDVVPKTWIKL